MGKIDPMLVLPRAFREHTKVPWWTLAVWGAFVACMLGYFALYGRPSRSIVAAPPPEPEAALEARDAPAEGGAGAPAAAPAAAVAEAGRADRVVAVRGAYFLTLELRGNDAQIQGSGLDGATLTGADGPEMLLKDADGKLRFRLKLKDGGDKARIYESDGTLRYRLKEGSDGAKFVVKDASGKDLARAKVKEDKVNIYDGSGDRVLRGRHEGGSVKIQRDSGGKAVLTIEGASGLDEAGIFALPLPTAEVALMWYAFGRR